MLQAGSKNAESGKPAHHTMTSTTLSRPDKPQPIRKSDAFSSFREKPESHRLSRSAEARSLVAMQFARQLKRLEVQKRARAAQAKGGRMDVVLDESHDGTKAVKESAKVREASRRTEAKGDEVSSCYRQMRI